MESVEKSKIFPPLPQPGDDGVDEKRRKTNVVKAIENPAFQEKQDYWKKSLDYNINEVQLGEKSKPNKTARLLVQI